MKRLAAALEEARMCRSRIGKEEAVARALAETSAQGGETELAVAARIAGGRALPVGDGRVLGVGGSLLFEAARQATGFDGEVLVACARTTGDLGEAFGLLTARDPGAVARGGVPLLDVSHLIDDLAAEPSRIGKRALLEATFARATPLETKYLCKALGGGMRIGAEKGVVEGAIGRAFGASIEEVRRAAALVADLGDLAVLAARRELAGARLEVGRPVAFMLATPIETLAAPIDPRRYVLEDKIDGVRAQGHHPVGAPAAIFARGLDRVTETFPEVAEALSATAEGTVFDGEIVALAPTGRPRPFQALQSRLKKNGPSAADRADTPVTFVVFDLLADPSGSLLALPWTERRSRLELTFATLGPVSALRLHTLTPLEPDAKLDRALEEAFAAARQRGQEGLVLKRADAPYDAGRRGQAWVKVKRAHGSIDAVIVAVEQGHGRRAGVLSDYTFAVWRDDDLVPIGKAYSGLTDDEIAALTRRLDAITVEEVGGLRVVRPRIVLEVAFDGVQRSTRHASGFALRFPRIVRVRDDKGPEEADRLATVEAIFEAQLASGHREPGTAADRKRAGKRAKATGQLSLFDDGGSGTGGDS